MEKQDNNSSQSSLEHQQSRQIQSSNDNSQNVQILLQFQLKSLHQYVAGISKSQKIQATMQKPAYPNYMTQFQNKNNLRGKFNYQQFQSSSNKTFLIQSLYQRIQLLNKECEALNDQLTELRKQKQQNMGLCGMNKCKTVDKKYDCKCQELNVELTNLKKQRNKHEEQQQKDKKIIQRLKQDLKIAQAFCQSYQQMQKIQTNMKQEKEYFAINLSQKDQE